MHLVSFTVSKYRSIKKAYKIRVGRQTILVGPNNEGKSNLLRALVTAMQVLTEDRFHYPIPMTRGTARFFRHRASYEWERDFPLDLQSKQPNGRSEVTLEFELSPGEIQEFREKIKSALNGTLPLRISLGPRADVSIAVAKKGPGSKILTQKSTAIAAFVSAKLEFEHIPAVRTASSAEEIVSTLVERELRALERDPEYVQAVEVIAKLQKPVLSRLSNTIKVTLVQFLPDVRGVEVHIPAEERYSAFRRSCEIVIDDGTPTLLKHKGDGVQSLAALGMMRHASESGASGRNLVIAIEEPESHLHPKAIHELKGVLSELSLRHQVVVTTHNPLFIDRVQVQNNVIVKDKKARPAKNVEELRDLLGVRAADNLRHAELVLLVEGADDRQAVRALLCTLSDSCKQAFQNGRLAIETLDGGTNLAYKAGMLREALCSVHAFLDHDESPKRAFDKAREQGLLADADVNWAICLEMRESELEDLYDSALYEQMVRNCYGVDLRFPQFQSRKRKWTERLRRTFLAQGKDWNDRVETGVKRKIGELVAASPANALQTARRGVIDGLAKALENRLDSLAHTDT